MFFFQMFVFGLCLISLLWVSYLQLCRQLSYVTFNTNLSFCTQRNLLSASAFECSSMCISLSFIGLMFSECPEIMLFIYLNTSLNYDPLIHYSLKFSKGFSKTIFIVSVFYMFSMAAVAQCLTASKIFRHICKSTSEWRGFESRWFYQSGFEFAETPLLILNH